MRSQRLTLGHAIVHARLAVRAAHARTLGELNKIADGIEWVRRVGDGNGYKWRKMARS